MTSVGNLLLHTCCGPCSIYVREFLLAEGYALKGFFYNPNIQPKIEYERRLLTMEHYATIVGFKVIYATESLLLSAGDCQACYTVRLQKTADLAKRLHFDAFSTTLLISPYQKHALLREIGEQVGEVCGVRFAYYDFRPGFRVGQNKAKEMGLYRQKYCGCLRRKNDGRVENLNDKNQAPNIKQY